MRLLLQVLCCGGDRALTLSIEVNAEVDFPRDRKDAKFLAYTLAGNVDFLITGDRDFTDVETLGNTQIVSVSGFVDRISGEGQD